MGNSSSPSPQQQNAVVVKTVQQQQTPSSKTNDTNNAAVAAVDPFAPVIPPNASNFYKRFPRRNVPEEYKPRAAVVGAGVAGLFSAWELSRLGFKVTVYDQFRQAGEGATKYDSGLVMHPPSAPQLTEKTEDSTTTSSITTTTTSPSSYPASYTFQPLIWRFQATQSYLKSLIPLLFSGASPVVGSETPLGGVIRESWRTWAACRRKMSRGGGSGSGEAGDHSLVKESVLIEHATALQRETASIIESMIEADPERLGKLIVASDKNVVDKLKSPWKVLDMSQWCKTFADILEKEYDVNFKYSNMVTRLQWRVDDQIEHVSSVVNTDMSGGVMNKKTFTSAADLFVISAGSMSILQRDSRAFEGYKLPLLSVAGFGLDIPVSMLGRDQSVKELLLQGCSNGSLDSLMPYQLSDSQFIRLMPTPPSAPVPLRKVGEMTKDDGSVSAVWDRVEPREARVRISGLMSLLGDDIKRNVQPTPSSCLNALAPRINRYKQNAANETQEQLLKIASESLQNVAKEYAIDNPESGVSGFRFARGYTADGLPLVSRLGNAKNAFLVCGFGDDASLLAPGAAAYLREMIMKRKPDTVKGGNPYSLDRFYDYHWLMKYEDDFDTIQEKWYKGETWLEKVGQPIIDMLIGDFWKSDAGQFISRGETKDADYGASKYE